MIKEMCTKSSAYTILAQAETASRRTFIFSSYVGSRSATFRNKHLAFDRKGEHILYSYFRTTKIEYSKASN